MPSPGGPTFFAFTRLQVAVVVALYPAVVLYCWAQSRVNDWKCARREGR